MKKPDYLISTPENVDLHLELAGIGSRICAAFVDAFLTFLLMGLAILIGMLVALLLERMQLPRDTKTMIEWYVVGVITLLNFCVYFGYFICFEGLWQGQTPGKRLAQIRVIEANGQPVNWASVWIRNLMRVMDVWIAMIGVLSMIVDKNERRLGDFAAGTLVIRERTAELSARNLKIQATDVPASFVDAGQMTPDEYHMLVNFLRRRHKMMSQSRFSMARQLDEYFRLKLNPENKGEGSEEFLEKLYLAYGARAELDGTH